MSLSDFLSFIKLGYIYFIYQRRNELVSMEILSNNYPSRHALYQISRIRILHELLQMYKYLSFVYISILFQSLYSRIVVYFRVLTITHNESTLSCLVNSDKDILTTSMSSYDFQYRKIIMTWCNQPTTLFFQLLISL